MSAGISLDAARLIAESRAPHSVAAPSVSADAKAEARMSQSTEDRVRALSTFEDAANALLGQLKSLDDRPKEHGEVGRAEIARTACSLLEKLAFLNEPAGPSLRGLLAHLLGVPHDGAFLEELDDIPTTDPEAWWRAVSFEAEHEPIKSGKAPSMASVSATARAAGKDRKTIRDWRLTERYQLAVEAARWALRVDARVDERKS